MSPVLNQYILMSYSVSAATYCNFGRLGSFATSAINFVSSFTKGGSVIGDFRNRNRRSWGKS